MRLDFVSPTEVIDLSKEPTLTIGSSFQSDIFYQFNNLVPADCGVFYFQNHKLIFASCDSSERIIEYGDEITLHGLWMMNLGKIFILFAREGDLRVATRERIKRCTKMK